MVSISAMSVIEQRYVYLFRSWHIYPPITWHQKSINKRTNRNRLVIFTAINVTDILFL